MRLGSVNNTWRSHHLKQSRGSDTFSSRPPDSPWDLWPLICGNHLRGHMETKEKVLILRMWWFYCEFTLFIVWIWFHDLPPVSRDPRRPPPPNTQTGTFIIIYLIINVALVKSVPLTGGVAFHTVCISPHIKELWAHTSLHTSPSWYQKLDFTATDKQQPRWTLVSPCVLNGFLCNTRVSQLLLCKINHNAVRPHVTSPHSIMNERRLLKEFPTANPANYSVV